jgi:SAM-dependent methyltransferase
MHASSLENIRRCRATYVDGEFMSTRGTVSVVDVGSSDVNGSYRSLFPPPRFEYLGLDLDPGKGVDLVLDDPHRLPLADSSADIVISGQMLEHCERFWSSFKEMIRVLRPDGLLFLVAPSAGPEHKFPVDCYRFLPDAYRALARYADCHLVDVWQDDKGPWNDLTGVFSRRAIAARKRVADDSLLAELDAVAPPQQPGSQAEERVVGDLATLGFLDRLHETLRPSLYVEIGVRRGDSLVLSRGRAVAIDPRPDPELSLPPEATLYTMSSDTYFESPAAAELGRAVDFAFIDGMHLAEFALRDFIHLEKHAAPWSVVAIDDVLPNHPAQASRQRRTRVWTGDVWRMVELLERRRPDLLILLVSTAPTGLALVAGLDADARSLLTDYNTIMSELRAGEAIQPGVSVLARTDALHPEDRRLKVLLSTLVSLGQEHASTTKVRSELEAWKRRYGR